MTLYATFTSRPSQMGDNVGDDDGTSKTPHISLPALLPALLALPCATMCQGPVSLSCRVSTTTFEAIVGASSSSRIWFFSGFPAGFPLWFAYFMF